MKSLTQRPRFYFVLFMMATLSGFGAQRVSALVAEPSYPNQCWYDTGTTPRCQYCDSDCLGSGYVCCRIVVQPIDAAAAE